MQFQFGHLQSDVVFGFFQTSHADVTVQTVTPPSVEDFVEVRLFAVFAFLHDLAQLIAGDIDPVEKCNDFGQRGHVERSSRGEVTQQNDHCQTGRGTNHRDGSHQESHRRVSLD